MFALLDEFAGMSNLLRRQLGLAAHLHPTGDRRRAARLGTFLNERAFQFRQYPDHLPHRAACWGRGVNRFRQRPEGDAPRLEVVQQADQVPQRAAQPVKLPDNKCIILSERFETLCQFRAPDMRSRGLVNKDALAPCLLEGGKLQVGVLVFGRDPCIADVHEAVLSLIYGTTKPLI